MGTTFRLVLIAALLATAALGVSLAAGQIVTPHLGCATAPASTTATGIATASAGDSSASAAEFLWSAKGPADDPMRFATSISGIAGGGPVAIDPACRVWVADTGNDRFAIFNPDGSFVEYWGEPGTGDGQFNMRSTGNDGFGAVAFAPDGTFYVLDIGNDRIQHFDSQRRFLGSWGGRGTDPGHYVGPLGIAVDTNSIVYVLDDQRDVVETYDRTGKVLGSFSPGLAGFSSNGMALDSQDNVYVTTCCSLVNEVRKFAPDGTLLAEIGSFGTSDDPQMTAVAVDASGRVFHRAIRVAAARGLDPRVRPGPNPPYGLWFRGVRRRSVRLGMDPGPGSRWAGWPLCHRR